MIIRSEWNTQALGSYVTSFSQIMAHWDRLRAKGIQITIFRGTI